MPKDYSSRYSGYPWFDTGTTRGTTTSTGVFTIQSAFLHKVFWGHADDALNRFRRADPAVLGGTTGTFLDFQPISFSGTIARFRVRQTNLSAGGTLSSFTLATSTSAVQAKYVLVGY